MANSTITAKHPHVQISTTDLSRPTAEVTQNGTGLFAVSRFAKGRDGVITKVSSPAQYITNYGTPDFKTYGQAPLNVANWLDNQGVAYILRVLPQNATHAHSIVSAQVKSDSNAKKRSVRLTAGSIENNFNISVDDIPSWKSDEYKSTIEETLLDRDIALDGYVKQYDLIAVSSVARGGYYNSYSFRLLYDAERSKNYDFAVYNITFYERSKNDTYTVAGTYYGSLFADSRSESGTSLFIEDVVNNNNDLFKIKIATDVLDKFMMAVPELSKSSDILFGTNVEDNTYDGWVYDYIVNNELDGMDLTAYSTLRKNLQNQYDKAYAVLNAGITVAAANTSPIIAEGEDVGSKTRTLTVKSSNETSVNRAKWTFDAKAHKFVTAPAKTIDAYATTMEFSKDTSVKVIATDNQTEITLTRPTVTCTNIQQSLSNVSEAARISYLLKSLNELPEVEATAYNTLFEKYSETFVKLSKITNRRDMFLARIDDICIELDRMRSQLAKYNNNEDNLREAIADYLDAAFDEMTKLLTKDLSNTSIAESSLNPNALYDATSDSDYFAHAYRTINKAAERNGDIPIVETDGLKSRCRTELSKRSNSVSTPTLKATIDNIKKWLRGNVASAFNIRTLAITSPNVAGTYYYNCFSLTNSINHDAALIALKVLGNDFLEKYPTINGNSQLFAMTFDQYTADSKKAYDTISTVKKTFIDYGNIELRKYNYYNLMVTGQRVPLNNGSDGSVSEENADKDWDNLLIAGYSGALDGNIRNFKEVNADVILDANYSYNVKAAIFDLINTYRDDIFFFCDNGIGVGSSSAAMAVDTAAGYSMFNDSYDVAFYAQTWDVVDPYTSNNIRVTFPYFFSKMLPAADAVYGIHQTLAGTNRGRINNSEFNRLSFNPNFDEREIMYLAKVNYAEKEPRWTKISTQVTTLATRDTALCRINNARVVKRIRKDIKLICEDYLQELNDSTTLARMNTAIREYLSQWKENRCCSFVNSSVTATEYERMAGIANVNIDLQFTGVIEIIPVNLVVQ